MAIIKDEILRACRHLLRPIVRFLLRSGVTWGEFSELSKEVYVDIARRDYGLHGRPTNVTRAAMITGLSRKEVGRVRNILAGQESPAAPEPRISQILTGWHLDPEFLDDDGQPAMLFAEASEPSLTSLFERYAGDFPHGALRKELLQLGLIKETANETYRVVSRNYLRQRVDPGNVRQLGVALHDHATTLAHNVDRDASEPPRFERIAANTNITPQSFAAFSSLIEERGQEFLEQIDAWLSEHEAAPSDRSNQRVRMGVGVYLICDGDG